MNPKGSNPRALFMGHKKGNEYAASLGALYNETPKAVLAALAVSLAVRIVEGEGTEDTFEAAARLVRDEWAALHRAGIVPQSPPKAGAS